MSAGVRAVGAVALAAGRRHPVADGGVGVSPSEANGVQKTIIKAAVSLAALLAVQIVCAIWWAATMDARMGHAEGRIDKLDNRVHAMEVDDR
jgi:hypothetical protein